MIEKESVPLVSLDSMNEVHFEEIAIINELLEQFERKMDLEMFSKSFYGLLEHMQEHFASEEKFMQESGYPSLQMHKADHDKVLNEARYADMTLRNRKDEDAMREYLEDELIPWLDQHIKAMDVPMADYVKMRNGL